jgi:6-phosphogluconolactonase/glucosamine-6-phosphate isomerase/deaminase
MNDIFLPSIPRELIVLSDAHYLQWVCRKIALSTELRERSAIIKAEASRYENVFCASVDILLLSVGAEGLRALLFPGSASLSKSDSA